MCIVVVSMQQPRKQKKILLRFIDGLSHYTSQKQRNKVKTLPILVPSLEKEPNDETKDELRHLAIML